MSDIEETSKAVQEVAKTTGKVVDASEKLGSFIARFVCGSLEQGVGIVEDRLRYMRWERQVRLMKRADDFMLEAGLSKPTRPLQLKFAIPLLQAASLEEDDYLQDLWAKLLVNSANSSSEIEQRRTYIDILERLSPLDAKILQKIYSLPFDKMRHKCILTEKLPENVSVSTHENKVFYNKPTFEIELSLANLSRLGVISVMKSLEGGELFEVVNQTLLGKKFIDACTLDKPT